MANARVAALVTEYFRGSHADVLVTKILDGYDLDGERMTSRVSLASLYLEQADDEDIGVGLAQKHGVPMFGSIGEALAVGGTGVNVDGVVLIGEHGHSSSPWPRSSVRASTSSCSRSVSSVGRQSPVSSAENCCRCESGSSSWAPGQAAAAVHA
jgi:hypothetical protein